MIFFLKATGLSLLETRRNSHSKAPVKALNIKGDKRQMPLGPFWSERGEGLSAQGATTELRGRARRQPAQLRNLAPHAPIGVPPCHQLLDCLHTAGHSNWQRLSSATLCWDSVNRVLYYIQDTGVFYRGPLR
ncbi:hypothetical protein RRG08_024729 [Elysia crispata]|uniref:Uncharacterized protein n=1 Tax=Elysia crispata TaxID=231223 RepID=A0AAE1CWY0_9GAST|nr:hypothetical protein RRG08_024729 [Elysia crispata]